MEHGLSQTCGFFWVGLQSLTMQSVGFNDVDPGPRDPNDLMNIHEWQLNWDGPTLGETLVQ